MPTHANSIKQMRLEADKGNERAPHYVYAELYERFTVCKANVTRPIKRSQSTEDIRQKGTTKCKWQAHLAYKKVDNK